MSGPAYQPGAMFPQQQGGGGGGAFPSGGVPLTANPHQSYAPYGYHSQPVVTNIPPGYSNNV